MCMLTPHTHSLTDEVCKPVRIVNRGTVEAIIHSLDEPGEEVDEGSDNMSRS